MRRWVIRILICLILGAVTTVAVAWWCVVRPEPPLGWFEKDTGSNQGVFEVWSNGFYYWGHHVIEIRPGEVRITHSPGVSATTFLSHISEARYQRELRGWSRFRDPASIDAIYRQAWSDGAFDIMHYEEYATGWPWLALRSRFLLRYAINEALQSVTLRRDRMDVLGAPIEVGGEPRSLLPLRPIWPGFVLNSITFGAPWFQLSYAFTSAKRFIRAKRGRCPRCGYDLRGQRVTEVRGQRSEISGARAGCPECGWNRATSGTRVAGIDVTE